MSAVGRYLHEYFPGISQPTLGYHMKALTGCGLVLAEKQGPWMRYRLDATRFEELTRYIGHLSTEKENCICGAPLCSLTR